LIHNWKNSKRTEPVQKLAETLESGLTLKDTKEERIVAPSVLEEEVETPIVKEKILPKVTELVQPVLVRDTQRTEVRHVVQPLYKKNVLPTEVIEAQLPVTEIPDTIEKPSDEEITKYKTAHFHEVPSSEVTEPEIHKTVLPPIVKERITPVIHEEIQPVIIQETIQPILIHETKPIYHRVMEAPKVVEEVRPIKPLEEGQALLEKVGQTNIAISTSGQAPVKEGQQ